MFFSFSTLIYCFFFQLQYKAEKSFEKRETHSRKTKHSLSPFFFHYHSLFGFVFFFFICLQLQVFLQQYFPHNSVISNPNNTKLVIILYSYPRPTTFPSQTPSCEPSTAPPYVLRVDIRPFNFKCSSNNIWFQILHTIIPSAIPSIQSLSPSFIPTEPNTFPSGVGPIVDLHPSTLVIRNG